MVQKIKKSHKDSLDAAIKLVRDTMDYEMNTLLSDSDEDIRKDASKSIDNLQKTMEKLNELKIIIASI